MGIMVGKWVQQCALLPCRCARHHRCEQTYEVAAAYKPIEQKGQYTEPLSMSPFHSGNNINNPIPLEGLKFLFILSQTSKHNRELLHAPCVEQESEAFRPNSPKVALSPKKYNVYVKRNDPRLRIHVDIYMYAGGHERVRAHHLDTSMQLRWCWTVPNFRSRIFCIFLAQFVAENRSIDACVRDQNKQNLFYHFTFTLWIDIY